MGCARIGHHSELKKCINKCVVRHKTAIGVGLVIQIATEEKSVVLNDAWPSARFNGTQRACTNVKLLWVGVVGCVICWVGGCGWLGVWLDA